METLLLLMLLPPLAGAALNGVLGRRFSQASVSVIGCGAAGLSMIFALLSAWTFSRPEPEAGFFRYTYFTWIQSGNFRADFALYYDRLTLVMTSTVTVVAFLIHLYSRGYMEREGGYYRFFAYLNLFLFMMLTLVCAGNYPLMFVGWEGVGLCSYLLIGFYFTRKSASDAGKKAFIVTRIGDVGFTLGVALIFWTLGTVDFHEVFERVRSLPLGESPGTLTAICLLLFLGAVGKSAQLPLYVWLPDAMEGPTPVSALIHAATMVTAGVYMVARSNVLYAHAPRALEAVAVVGCITAFFAASIALCQNDLKRMLAYSTISQLGYMVLGCGAGLFATGIFHLMTHAFFKSLLFLASRSVMPSMGGELDLRKLGGLGQEGFARYLAPVFESSESLLRSGPAREAEHGLGVVLMLGSLAAAAAGIALAWWFYLKRTEAPKRLAERFSGLYRVLVHKYYVDEFYDWLVVRPARVGSEKALWRGMDAGLIDGTLVNGTAHATASVGRLLRRMQSGNLRSYAAWVLLGAVLWLGYIAFR